MHAGYTVSRAAIWLGFTLLFATCVAAQMHAHEPHRSDKQWLSSIKLKAPQPQEQFAAYWTTEPGWHTDIQLRNNMPNQILTVTPVARTADGNEISLTAVTLQPNQVQSIDLAELLSKSAPQLIGHYGSLIFRYNSPFLKISTLSRWFMMQATPWIFILMVSHRLRNGRKAVGKGFGAPQYNRHGLFDNHEFRWAPSRGNVDDL